MKIIRTLTLLLALAFAAPLAFTGCQTAIAPAGVYGGNSSLYATDASITAAFQVLDVFMVFQYQNRASLPAEVNAFADRARRDAPGWARSIIALRDIYATSPTPENKTSLDQILRLVRGAVVQASTYLVEKP